MGKTSLSLEWYPGKGLMHLVGQELGAGGEVASGRIGWNLWRE